MPTRLVPRIRQLLTAVLRGAHARARAATRPTSVLAGLASDAFRSREELIAENALLGVVLATSRIHPMIARDLAPNEP